MSKKPQQVISKFFTEISGPSGSDTENMNPVAGTGTPAPTVYEVTVPADTRYHITRIHFLIKDTLCQAGKFGGIAALTNGVKIQVIDADAGATVLVDFLDGKTIKMNEDFDWLAGIDVPGLDATVSTDIIPVRWTLRKDLGGEDLELVAGQRFRITLQDDLSGLTEWRTIAKGFSTSG